MQLKPPSDRCVGKEGKETLNIVENYEGNGSGTLRCHLKTITQYCPWNKGGSQSKCVECRLVDCLALYKVQSTVTSFKLPFDLLFPSTLLDNISPDLLSQISEICMCGGS